MDSLLIKGGVALEGEVAISGAKNAVLPIMAATLLTSEPCIIHRVPDLSDVRFMGQILTWLGADVHFEKGSVRIRAKKIKGAGDYDLIRKMRGSICIMGPLLGRLGKATVSLPGGCVIGARPINLHLKGFEALGAKVVIESGYVQASAKRLVGSPMFLGGRAGSTVLGTANVMMAAALADGITVIESAACEPEVVDLARFLTAMGAKISGAGSPTMTITGVKSLHGAEHEVIPDRIEAATYAIAAAATGGDVLLRGARPDHMHAIMDKLSDAGAKIEQERLGLRVRRNGRLKPVDITTLESRFMHVSELARLGADIEIEGPSAIIKGGKALSGAPVMASDLRASAALVIAGLAARGTTQVNRVYHIDRGYETIDAKLRQLGARVERIEES